MDEMVLVDDLAADCWNAELEDAELANGDVHTMYASQWLTCTYTRAVPAAKPVNAYVCTE
jgi:hypothetical protein